MRASTSTFPEAICRALRRSKPASGAGGALATLEIAGACGFGEAAGVDLFPAGAADARKGDGAALEKSPEGRSTIATRGLALTGSSLRVACSHSLASSAVMLRPPPPDLWPVPLIAGLSPAPARPAAPRRAPVFLSA